MSEILTCLDSVINEHAKNATLETSKIKFVTNNKVDTKEKHISLNSKLKKEGRSKYRFNNSKNQDFSQMSQSILKDINYKNKSQQSISISGNESSEEFLEEYNTPIKINNKKEERKKKRLKSAIIYYPKI